MLFASPWHLSCQETDKIRVVFDCSSKYQGISLNEVLLHEPDLTNNLFGVLMRFSLGDIECMFYQVNVLNDDCDCLRFIWWPGEKLDAAPVTYRMNVHLFGATSSPSCANFALLQCVEDNREYFDPVTCKAVENNFYVDDFLLSVPTV